MSLLGDICPAVASLSSGGQGDLEERSPVCRPTPTSSLHPHARSRSMTGGNPGKQLFQVNCSGKCACVCACVCVCVCVCVCGLFIISQSFCTYPSIQGLPDTEVSSLAHQASTGHHLPGK